MAENHPARARARLAASAVLWAYAAVIAGSVALMYLGGDRWWPATLLLFGPRWLLAIPLILVLPAVFLADVRRAWIPLILGVGLLVPLLSPCVTIHAYRKPGGSALRVMTCNVNVSGVAYERVQALAGAVRADVVALQECRGEGPAWPDGWYTVSEGGLTVASRYPILQSDSIMATHPPHTFARVSVLKCVIRTPHGLVSFYNVHLPSARYGLTEVLDRRTGVDPSQRATLVNETENRREVSARVVGLGLSERVKGNPNDAGVLFAGDFNMPVESTIYRRDWSRFANAFGRAGRGLGWTQRQVFHGVPFGIRIDHVLMGKGWEVRRAWVARDVGSDHRPVVVEMVWKR